MRSPEASDIEPGWGFFTNHGLVLVYVAQHRDSTVREISDGIALTERATLSILRALDEEGIIERHREGRRNTYSVNFERLAAFRRQGVAPLTPARLVNDLISTLLDISHRSGANGRKRPQAPRRPEAENELEPRLGSWGLFTNHLRILIALALDSSRTIHELATPVSVTERAAGAILKQLEDEGIISRERIGRRNAYSIDFKALREFPRWSPGPWPLPPRFIDAAVDGLRRLAEHRR
jgi:DNA-binding transcriptional ArsR family regulator